MVPIFFPGLVINTYTNFQKTLPQVVLATTHFNYQPFVAISNHSFIATRCRVFWKLYWCHDLGKRKVPLSFCIQGLSKFLSCDCLRANKSHLFDSQAVQIHRPILCNYLHLFAHQKVWIFVLFVRTRSCCANNCLYSNFVREWKP